MAISHTVTLASPDFADRLTIGLNAPDLASYDAALTALLDLDGTDDCVDMWRLGGDVGEVLNQRLHRSEPFWALGWPFDDEGTITYLDRELVAGPVRRGAV